MRLFGILPALFAVTLAHATTIATTFGPAGQSSADVASLCANTTACVVGVENFDTVSTANLTAGFTTDFGTSGRIVGAYSVPNPAGTNVAITQADQYGGAGHAGSYPVLFNGGYALNLSTSSLPGVNYFGLWVSALDANNDLKFFSGNTLLLDFTPALMTHYIQLQPNASAYYGNPVTHEDGGEPFAFVNFFAQGGTFDRVAFGNAPGTGFESDNDTVAYRTPSTGVFGNAIPEPRSIALVGAGLVALGIVTRRRAPASDTLARSRV